MRKTWEMQVGSVGREDPLEEGVVTHSSVLAWRIPWTLEPGGLPSIVSKRFGHSWSDLARTHRAIVMDWTFVSLPSSYAEALVPDLMGFGCGTLECWLGLEQVMGVGALWWVGCSPEGMLCLPGEEITRFCQMIPINTLLGFQTTIFCTKRYFAAKIE